MRKLRKILRLLIVVFLAGVLILLVILNAEINKPPTDENKYYIPKNALFVAKFDVHQLILHTAQTIALSQDEQLMKDGDYLYKKWKDRNKNGINYQSDVYYFVLLEEGELVEGILYNLSNKDEFIDFYHKDDFTGITASNDEVGVIFLGENGSLEAKKLQQLANEIISNKENKRNEIELIDDGNNIISTWSKFNNTISDLYSTALDLELKDHSVEFAGKVMMSNTSAKGDHLALSPSGLHITSSLLPKWLNDSLNSIYPAKNRSIRPKLIRVSANYNGLEIRQTDRTEFRPDVQLLLEFDHSIDLDSALFYLVDKKILSHQEENRFEYEGLSIRIHQLKPNVIYINQGEMGNIDTVLNSDLLILQGIPKTLFAIRDNTGISRLFDLLPTYSSGKKLAKRMKSVDIRIEQGTEHWGIIKGKLAFSADKYAAIEILKFLDKSSLGQ